MSKDCYMVSKDTLNAILECADSMLEWGVFMVGEHRCVVDDFRSDVLCDCVEGKLKSDYTQIYKFVNVVCNDGRVR